MMRVPFIKMHGLGNDFIILDGRSGGLPQIDADLVQRLAHRQTGVGCDQLVLIENSAFADARMRIFNPDGSEVEACGNATRAIAMWLGESVKIETKAGILAATYASDGISVEMGVPRFEWQSIPLTFAMDTLDMPVSWGDLANPSAVNVGNPHVVFFVKDTNGVPLNEVGPVIENDGLFPQRINVCIATVTSRDTLRLRVWERGAGCTLACGTGACAATVTAIRRGLVERRVMVTLPGGRLTIEWRADNQIIMTGPAAESFRGSFDMKDYVRFAH